MEIENLLEGISHAGFRKLRITGGEPTLRADLIPIIEAASRMPGLETRALSTNGWNLHALARPLRTAGLTHLNVSVDSLDRNRFKSLTGRDSLDRILAGVEEALSLGFQGIKLNAVLHKDTAMTEFEAFLDYVRTRPISVRFIELMRTRDRAEYRDRHFVSAGTLKATLYSQGWKPLTRGQTAGPALEFGHSEFRGRIGLIAPHSDGFCETCNRLRITSRGKLKLCLFGDQDESIRDLLQSRSRALGLGDRIQKLLHKKPPAHELARNEVGGAHNFSVMGG